MGLFKVFKDIGNALFGGIGRASYKSMFEKNLCSFESFLELIKFEEIKNNTASQLNCSMKEYIKFDNGKCSYKKQCHKPCKYNAIYVELYRETSIDDLRKIYDHVKNFEFDTKMKMRIRMLSGYYIYRYLEPSWYYGYNISRVYNYLYDELIQKHKSILKGKTKIEIQKKKELDELEKKKKSIEARTLVKVIKINKSTNPFQNNAPSLRIEYEILDTGEIFADYLTQSESELMQYKVARFIIATSSSGIIERDIFGKDFVQWKNNVIGKELYADLKKQNNKISVDLFIDSIFYKK